MRKRVHRIAINDLPLMVKLVAQIDPDDVTGDDAAEGIAVILRCRAIEAVAKKDDVVEVVR